MTLETIKQIAQDAGVIYVAVVTCTGTVCTLLAHMPLPAKWAEFFARGALWASNHKFSVNERPVAPVVK